MSTLHRLHGSLAVARQLPAERRAAYRDPGRIAALRDRRLRSLVRYAAASVPHYRELFREVDPAGIRTVADLELLPTVTKAEVQRDPRRFVADGPDGRNAVRFTTSGSTGMPLEIWHDRASLLANIARSERERAVESHFCGKRVRYSAVSFGHGRSATRNVQDFYAASTLRPVRPGIGFLPIDRPVEETVAELNRLRPDVIRGLGTYVEALFRHVAARGLRLEPPRVVICAGDAITPEGRAFIEDEFGIPVLRRYAAIESFKIGFTCERRDVYHLHDDLCHVRAVDGQLVLTNLVNRGTVLLNYAIGDLGRLPGRDCDCGRGLPLLDGLDGRVSAVLELPNGALVHSIAVWGVLRDFRGLLQFQLVQDGPADYELRVATADRAAFERIAAGAVPRLSALLAGATVEATRHDQLHADDGRKLATVVRLGAGA